jgi:hypothetical protein
MADAKAKIVNTQQLSRRTPSVSRQRMASSADMRLPGERLIKKAEGEVKEGSFRVFSEVMDNITGNSNESMDMTVTQEPGL